MRPRGRQSTGKPIPQTAARYRFPLGIHKLEYAVSVPGLVVAALFTFVMSPSSLPVRLALAVLLLGASGAAAFVGANRFLRDTLCDSQTVSRGARRLQLGQVRRVEEMGGALALHAEGERLPMLVPSHPGLAEQIRRGLPPGALWIARWSPGNRMLLSTVAGLSLIAPLALLAGMHAAVWLYLGDLPVDAVPAEKEWMYERLHETRLEAETAAPGELVQLGPLGFSVARENLAWSEYLPGLQAGRLALRSGELIVGMTGHGAAACPINSTGDLVYGLAPGLWPAAASHADIHVAAMNATPRDYSLLLGPVSLARFAVSLITKRSDPLEPGASTVVTSPDRRLLRLKLAADPERRARRENMFVFGGDACHVLMVTGRADGSPLDPGLADRVAATVRFRGDLGPDELEGLRLEGLDIARKGRHAEALLRLVSAMGVTVKPGSARMLEYYRVLADGAEQDPALASESLLERVRQALGKLTTSEEVTGLIARYDALKRKS